MTNEEVLKDILENGLNSWEKSPYLEQAMQDYIESEIKSVKEYLKKYKHEKS